MTEFDGHASALVGDVDCTAAGKPLCDSNGVRGFPTIKFGDPSNLEDYKGGRDFDALSKFASESTFKSEVEKLQATYEKLQKDKEDTLESAKNSGLGVMKAVKAAGGAAKKEL